MDSTITNNEAEPTIGELVAYFDWRFYAQVIALFVLRYGLHAVLIHEEHAVTIGPPHVCARLENFNALIVLAMQL